MSHAVHVRTVLREQPVVDQLLADISQVPTARLALNAGNLLGQEQRDSAERSELHRAYLFGFAAALAGLLLYAAIGLIRGHAEINRVNQALLGANATLEQRVEERTRELREAQGEVMLLGQLGAPPGDRGQGLRANPPAAARQAAHASDRGGPDQQRQAGDVRPARPPAHAAAPRRRTSFELDSAFQGEQALAMVAALQTGRPYALAFVDMRMPPGWDGVETIERLWRIDPRLQVVICTAFSDH